MVRDWGHGLLRISKSLENHGLPPLEVLDDCVSVRGNVRRRMVDSALSADMEKVPIDERLSAVKVAR